MKYVVTLNGKDYEVEVDELSEVSGSGTAVKAPMPGTILKVNVTAGQSVKAGDIMFILEAMKMETSIVANQDGVIDKIYVKEGEQVNQGDLLVSFVQEG